MRSTAQKSVVILGSGGREAALAWKLQKDVGSENIWVLPGNAGIPNSKNIDCMNAQDVLNFCDSNNVQLVVVGPEAPLAAGVSDFLRNHNITVFGPSQQAARLETSKIFAKQFMNRHFVQTAKYAEFQSVSEANAYVQKSNTACVIKYDGLAAGKGVAVCSNTTEALAALNEMAEAHGEQCSLLVEEKLNGTELSLIVITDGKTWNAFPFAQDHKRLWDADCGPNTGGMGACAPVPNLPEKIVSEIFEKIVKPTMTGLRAENFDYRGFLYFGVMLTAKGPFLLEYNVRMGDPETQVLVPCIQSSLYDSLYAAAQMQLSQAPLIFNNQFFAGVVFTCAGYALPASASSLASEVGSGVAPAQQPQKILGLEKLQPETLLFHASTLRKQNSDNENSDNENSENKNSENKNSTADCELFANKGRAFVIGSAGKTPQEALPRVYSECDKVRFEGYHFRRDIGARWLNPLPRIEPVRVAILASGTGSNMKAIVENAQNGILKGICTVALVASDVANAPSLSTAREKNIFAAAIPRKGQTQAQFELALTKLLRSHKIDCVVLAGFMRILSASFVSEFRGRIVNIHPADTKQHSGTDGYEWAFRNKLEKTFVTVHLVDEGLDTGPILAQGEVNLVGAQTLDQVKTLGLAVEHKLYSETLRDYFLRI